MSNKSIVYVTKVATTCSPMFGHLFDTIGPLHDPVTWYGINYTGTQITQWDFQNKGKSGWTGVSSFALEVPLRHLRPSVIYSVPCDRIVQRAYYCGIDGRRVATRRIERSGFEPWSGTLCCVLGQDTLLSQCLSPPRSGINGYQQA